MPEIYWTTVAKFPNIVTQAIWEPWLAAAEVVRDCTHIRLRATGNWSVLADDRTRTCGPDGYPDLTGPEKVIADCSVGALIGRFGGSSAGYAIPAADDTAKVKPFSVGSYCIVTVPTRSIGPLFISFNSTCRPIVVNRMTLTIEGANPTL